MLLAMMLLSAACAPAAPLSVIESPTPPRATPTSSKPTLTLVETSTLRAAGTSTPSGCMPGERAELVWPRLEQLEPPKVVAGKTVKVSGWGGHVRCEEGGYNESARKFELYLDGKPITSFVCYVNHCENSLFVPLGTPPGTHVISVEGGSTIDLLVLDN